ncbi:hypothetical protein [Nocardioides sp. PD653]|uniref:hypothetical protein n=1 Tax=Nocardioides sp. PD653 TaxID=393303 RepID=UPI0009EF8BAA|nr:hypothetical protein [Nocardioides sp. PD653]GAW54724.1 hypothetical protein PD653_2138 [Nocardioides sp. PD653]
MTEWWNDEQLNELRVEHLRTLAAWHELRPDAADIDAELNDAAKTAKTEAMEAEAAYDARRRELGLL